MNIRIRYPAIIVLASCCLMLCRPCVLCAADSNGREEIVLESDKQQASMMQEMPRQKTSLSVNDSKPSIEVKPQSEPEQKIEPKPAGPEINTSDLNEPIVRKLMRKIGLKAKNKEVQIKSENSENSGRFEKPEKSKKPEAPIGEGTIKSEEAVRPTAATPFVRMVNKMFQYPQDAMSAAVREGALIGTFGGWANVEKTQKNKFSHELGLSGMKTSDEKPAQVLTLKECIDIAVKNHLPLSIAKKSIRLAELRVFEARRNLLPSVTIAYETSTGRVNNRAYTSRKQYIEGQQPIFHGGDLYYNFKQTETNLEITKNDYNRIKNELVLQVKKGYYSFAKAKENLKFQRKLSEEANNIYEMVKKQYEYNIAPKLEFLNVSSQASQIKYQLASAEGDVGIAELILKQAMNISSHDRIDVTELLPFRKSTIDYENTLRAAMLNRPEMKINSLMMEYYNYGKGIARAKGLPKIDLLGQWGLAKDEYTSQDSNYNPEYPDDNRKMEQQWYAGVKASIPFWGSTGEYTWTKEQWVPQVSTYSPTMSDTNSFKLKVLDKLDAYSDLKLAEIDYDKAMQELVKIRQDVTLEVQEGCFNYNKAVIQLDTAAAKLEYQLSDLEINRMKRGLDEIPDSAVIESMIKLAQEKFGYTQALSDCYISLAAINKAVGIEDYYKEE